MRRLKLEAAMSMTRHRSLQTLATLFLLYAALVFFYEFPFMSRNIDPTAARGLGGDAIPRHRPLHSSEDTIHTSAPARPSKRPHRLLANSDSHSPLRRRSPVVSGLVFQQSNASFSDLDRSAAHAWELGGKLFSELQLASSPPPTAAQSPSSNENRTDESCPKSIVLTGAELREKGSLMVVPCGLTLGSHITLIGRPRAARPDYNPKIRELKEGDRAVMVSQFMMELQGLKAVDGEAPPKILHFNPRLKGDWSGRPVIEQNTCYRMQWGTALRCEGRPSRSDEETVDGLVKCEKWIEHGERQSGEETKSKTKLWNRLISPEKKEPIDWVYPFVEDKLFVLTLSTGLEGYHITVDGRHVTSFPYHPGFALEDATGLVVSGDIEVQSLFAASLPTSHPSFSSQRSLQMLPQWKAPPLPDGPVELFIGILSAGNHFAERMAVRKSWMSSARKSSNVVVARFFVALNGRKEVNEELKKEAEFFGDVVIVPYMDSYDLVVLKTVAICEFGVHVVSAKYIMKCDDDTFVRVDYVLQELKKVPSNMSLYVGNMNFHHKPLRSGKWAVTFEEWPEEDYPTYANGPGYFVSSDIAHFVVSEFENHTLRLFKMEDVSMGMWVGQFNDTRPVEYLHSYKFCQFGCINGYFTAHYQSPRQMMCLWEKLRAGKPQCCNMG